MPRGTSQGRGVVQKQHQTSGLYHRYIYYTHGHIRQPIRSWDPGQCEPGKICVMEPATEMSGIHVQQVRSRQLRRTGWRLHSGERRQGIEFVTSIFAASEVRHRSKIRSFSIHEIHSSECEDYRSSMRSLWYCTARKSGETATCLWHNSRRP